MPRSLPESSTTVDPRLTKLQRLRQMSRLLDSAIAIPGTRYRFGLDPILGLIPGGGDLIGLVLSSYIVIEAARLGASKETLGQMMFNILLETTAGTVPVLGDFFDVAWKSNVKNIRLLEEHLDLPEVTRPRNRWLLVFMFVGFILAIAGLLTLTFFTLRWLIQAIH